jgi:high-affinity iron transporter
MFLRVILNGWLVLAVSFAIPVCGAAQESPAKRLSAIVGVAVEEYAKGLDASGKIISAVELEEAAGFFKDAQEVARRLNAAAADRARLILDSLAAAATRRAKPAELVELQKKLALVLGAEGALDLPSRAIDFARGKALFEQNCLPCHGSAGKGDGPNAAALNPHPANIGSAGTMHDKTPTLMYRTVSVGVPGTPMASWANVLTPDDRWAVVAYINSLRASDADRRAGDVLLGKHCPKCAGDSPAAIGTFGWQVARSDAELAAAIATDEPTTGLVGGRTLNPVEIAQVVAALRATAVVAAVIAQPEVTSDAQDPRTAARQVVRLIDDALAAARGGRAAAAGDLAFDAYIAFEPLEGPARMRDPGLVATMERHFADFKGAVKANDLAAAGEARSAIETGMPQVLELATPTSTTWGVFLESFLIIVREGFEAILVLGAVVAFLIKTGNRARLRDIWIGTGLGLGASALLAVLMRTILVAVPASREVIEGVTMLVAVVVLFSVSYWLLSKVEGAKWQKFIRDKVNSALSHGGSFALAFVAFLAVFREGAETALFYQALFTRGNAVAWPVSFGLLAGFATLTVIFTLFHRFGVKIPLRPFFAVTSALLYYMAYVFAGKGINELQEGNVVSRTRIPGFPHVEALGLYPTVETLIAQAILMALLLFALWRALTPSAADEQEEAEASVPPEVASRIAELQATARRLQDRVDTLEKEIEQEITHHTPPEL